jgi:hypothetical protein
MMSGFWVLIPVVALIAIDGTSLCCLLCPSLFRDFCYGNATVQLAGPLTNVGESQDATQL